MTTSGFLYRLLRIVRVTTAVRKGRVVPYARRSLVSTLVGKTTARWGR